MTQEEAEKIAAIFMTADNGCVYCAEALCDEFNEGNFGWEFVFDAAVDSFIGVVAKQN